jgi:hypothetical protein
MLAHGLQNHASETAETDEYEAATKDLARRMLDDKTIQKAFKILEVMNKKAELARKSNNKPLNYVIHKQRKRLLKGINAFILNNMSDKEKELAYDKSEKLRQLDKNAVDYKSKEDIDRVLMTRIKNPETENSILVKTALHYGPQHPAYKIARNMLNKFIGERDG